jgi:hypothetical protein
MLDKSPLSRRGWALQENLLSRRAILFGSGQIHWECRTAQSSESQNVWFTGVSRELKSDIEHKFASWKGLTFGQTDVSRTWQEIARKYMKRSLTFDRDILPAISGIARYFGGRTNYTYRAGLWLEDMHRLLLWRVFIPRYQTHE